MELDNTLLDRLETENLSMLVVDQAGERFRSTGTGVRPLLELADRFPEGLPGATVADRIVGGCAARVFAHLKLGAVLGLQGSERAAAILAAAAIPWQFRETVPDIRNRAGDGVCPFELLSRRHSDPRQLLAAIRALLDQFARG